MIFRNYILALSLICCFGLVEMKRKKGVTAVTNTNTNNNITRCDQLPKVQLRSPTVAVTSPFHVYRSNQPGDMCTTGVVTGPGGGVNNTQNLTFILIQKTGLRSIFSVQPGEDDMSTYLTQCGNASNTFHYYSFLFEINATNSVNCPYSCDPSGLALDVFRCYGHTVEDEAVIQQAIDQYMPNVPGYKDIFDAQAGCHYSSYCSDYF